MKGYGRPQLLARIVAATNRFRSVELLKLLLVASVAGPALITALLGWYTYRVAFADARRELERTGEVAREHASKVFDSFRLLSERVVETLDGLDDNAIRASEPALRVKFSDSIRRLPQIQSLTILDRSGHPLVATSPYLAPQSGHFSDRDYFSELKSGAAQNYVSRLQIDPIAGRTFFDWAEARRGADGAFEGVVDIAVSPEFFMNFYEKLISELDGGVVGRAVTMVRDDGDVLVRYPNFPGAPMAIPASNVFFKAVQASPSGGLYLSTFVIDPSAPERLFAYQKAPDYPIYLVAGRSRKAIVRDWISDMFGYGAVAVPGSAAMFLLTLATLRGARRERLALAQARDEMDRRVQVESQLFQSQKLEAIGQLTGGMAHDFNNLLTVIRSSVDLLRRPELPDERRRRYLEAISDTTNRAAKLTGQLLAFARRQPLKPEPLNVVENVTAVIEMVRALTGPKITIETDFPDAPLYVNADPSQFDTSIVNLAVNARDAMDGQGRLSIAIRAADEIPAFQSRAAIKGFYVAVAVSDSGSGIASELLDRIFEPFFTTKEVGQGTGLGLPQVLGFTKQSGGEMTVESARGCGATFTLYLPRIAPVARPSPASEPAEAVVDDGLASVLVVEDDIDVAAFVVQTLRELGYATVLAGDAREAIAELSKGADRFDVVFSDVVMPGMSGDQLAREIARRHGDLPVVLTSGYSDALARGGEHGFEVVQKPFAIQDLSRALQSSVRRRRARRAAAARA